MRESVLVTGVRGQATAEAGSRISAVSAFVERFLDRPRPRHVFPAR
jgi:hypothetical protein